MQDQLQAFHYSLIRYGEEDTKPCPKSWLEAFFRLERLLEAKRDGAKQVVFIDEVTWIDTPKSKFLSAFENFYNGWAVDRKDVLLVICGSSSSWILSKIVNNTGGLYNRITCQMKLSPFTLKEAEAYFKMMGLNYGRYDILRAYMVFGGIPYYMNYFVDGNSLEQNVDNALFKENAPLKGEFQRLFNTLFTHSDKYVKIVRTLSERNYGYTRDDLSAKSGIPSGGGLSDMLEKLADADFIEEYKPVFSSSREPYYRLKDCFCIFYLKFIDGKKGLDNHFWQNSSSSKNIKPWEGIAFEQICWSHLDAIKYALGIPGVVTVASRYIAEPDGDKKGAQIDLVIDRADRNINLCEMKFYASEVSLEKKDDLAIRNRASVIREKAGARKNVFLTLITTYGLKYNMYSGVFQKVLTMDDLFA
jgi:hypothetical protein